MNFEELRAEFEAQEPVPKELSRDWNIYWWRVDCEHTNNILPKEYNAKWQGYQLRHAKLEARIAELEKQLYRLINENMQKDKIAGAK